MVFGMPMTLILRPRRAASSADGMRAPQRAVAADGEEDADLHALQGVDHLGRRPGGPREEPRMVPPSLVDLGQRPRGSASSGWCAVAFGASPS